MFAIDALPDMPNTRPPVILVAQAENAAARAGKASAQVIGTCIAWDYIKPGVTPAEGQGGLAPNYDVRSYFFGNEKQWIKLPPKENVRLLQEPRHGTVTHYEHPTNESVGWRYLPNPGYVGDDRIEFVVNTEKGPIKIIYFFKVTKLDIDRGEAEGLCKRLEWRISGTDDAGVLANTSLPTLLAAASRSTVGFTDLPGTAVAQTTGTYSSGQITLDSNAAGHSWYLDPTIWKAKPDSEAAGKMDLLSVLLHEYGYILGLEHSGNARNFMAATRDEDTAATGKVLTNDGTGGYSDPAR